MLSFVDSKPYHDADRAGPAQERQPARRRCAGPARSRARRVVLAALDFAFIGGSLGAAAGRGDHPRRRARGRDPHAAARALGLAAARACRRAVWRSCSSRRPRQAIARLHEAGVLYVSLLLDPTYGGVSASFATLGDILVAEPGVARRLRRPEGDRADDPPDAARPASRPPSSCSRTACSTSSSRARACAARCTARSTPTRRPTVRGRTARCRPAPAGRGPRRTRPRCPCGRPWEIVQLARTMERPTTLEYVGHVFDDFQELAGRPAVLPGRRDRRRARAPRGAHRDAHRAPEGAHDLRAARAQLRDAPARGLPQGAAPDAPRGEVRDADRHPRRLPGRLSRRRRRGARPGDRDRPLDHGDVAAARADRSPS